MTEYIYIVKCPGCEDEMFNFFNDARMQCDLLMSKHPIITQVEVERNDFGECTDHHDLGTVWSWEEVMKDTEGGYADAEPTKSVFTKDDLKLMADGKDPEFDDDDFYFDNNLVEDASTRFSFKNTADREEFFKLCREIGIITGADLRKFMDDTDANDGNLLDKLRAYRAELGDDFKIEECARKPIPEGMTIEELVEEMEKNEDTVECVGCEELHPKADCTFNKEIGWVCPDCEDRIVKCTWCDEIYDKSECRYEVDLGWLCDRCEAAIKSRGETLTFREGSYWDFLDEEITAEHSLADLVKDSINHLVNDLGKDSTAEDFVDDVILDIERNYDTFVPEDPMNHRKWASAIASEVSRQLNNQLDEEVKEIHDLGNEYDGGYPEIEEVSDSHLKLCPECGKETFDNETGICVNCGFN